MALLLLLTTRSADARGGQRVWACQSVAVLLDGIESGAPSLGGTQVALDLAQQLAGDSKPPRVLLLTCGAQAVGAAASRSAPDAAHGGVRAENSVFVECSEAGRPARGLEHLRIGPQQRSAGLSHEPLGELGIGGHELSVRERADQVARLEPDSDHDCELRYASSMRRRRSMIAA